ncbi:uncharacterized protein LOC123529720 [Mercenaria mercenaria]|uniref:uncharacterized protein LOC123529720 n=1 Tax=Mercenaria mercenaria TaxID=6596 RepID=UPI00234F7FF8|nr:uncharacterized protein LOC123529720 [Mercenaria mercenaria]
MDCAVLCFVLFCTMSFSYGDEGYDTDPCEPGDTGVYPHSKCQMYYNCSMKITEFRPWLGDHVMECHYPDLFSTLTESCANFKTVTCGSRKEFKHGCEYLNNQCNGPQCRSCIYDYSKCTVRNGFIPMDSMPNSPYYGECDEWRFTKMTCPRGKIFDQTSKVCKPY